MQSRLIRLPHVEDISGLKKSSIYNMIEKGEFPKQIKLGERSVAWIESEVNDWVKSRISASRGN